MNPTRDISRFSSSGSLEVSTFRGSGTIINTGLTAGGMLYIPSGNSCDLSFHASYDGSNFFNTYDKTGTVVTRTISNANEDQCIPVPDECYGAGYLEITSDVAIGSIYYTLKG